MKKTGLFLQDTTYFEGETKHGYTLIGIDAIPVDIFTPLSVLRYKKREYRYFYKIGKQPKLTPAWRLKQIIKKIS